MFSQSHSGVLPPDGPAAGKKREWDEYCISEEAYGLLGVLSN
jgi:hypothetical protein